MYDMNDVKNFEYIYKVVFDEHKQVKNCGREACIKLIKAARKCEGTTGGFGNTDTGYMNVAGIADLHDELINIGAINE